MAIDSYMNLQLGNTEEYIDGELAGNLGEVTIIVILWVDSNFLFYRYWLDAIMFYMLEKLLKLKLSVPDKNILNDSQW